jgi:arabinofuranosyltransferase
VAIPIGVATFPGDIPGTGFRRPEVRPSGIVDERRYYASETGLFGPQGIRSAPDLRYWAQAEGWSRQGIRVRTVKMAGFAGYLAGPGVHLLDVMALADPLLARLPARRPWRVGHYERDVPAGYLQTVRTGNNVIEDPRVARLWTRVALVTRGPIWSATRWEAMRALGVSGGAE